MPTGPGRGRRPTRASLKSTRPRHTEALAGGSLSLSAIAAHAGVHGRRGSVADQVAGDIHGLVAAGRSLRLWPRQGYRWRRNGGRGAAGRGLAERGARNGQGAERDQRQEGKRKKLNPRLLDGENLDHPRVLLNTGLTHPAPAQRARAVKPFTARAALSSP